MQYKTDWSYLEDHGDDSVCNPAKRKQNVRSSFFMFFIIIPDQFIGKKRHKNDQIK